MALSVVSVAGWEAQAAEAQARTITIAEISLFIGKNPVELVFSGPDSPHR
jgi:hypothetical protein